MNSLIGLVVLALPLLVSAGGSSSVASLAHTCYPNGTIIVTNPNSGTYTNVVAVEDTGSGSAADCSVSVSGSTVEITNCALDQYIVIHFSDRASTSGGDSIFGGDSVDSYTIHCAQISDSGVDRTVDDSLAATLETSTEAEVTPSFAISTELRGIASLTAAEVTQADVGDSIYWTLDVPSDYTARPSCTAYSGTDNTGTSKTLFTNGCADDDDLVSDDFTSTSTIVPLINRYYVTLYVFKFYDSDDVYFHCTVKVCPSSGSANCAASCTKKKRSIDNSTLEAGDRFFETNRVLHILPAGSGAPTLLACYPNGTIIVTNPNSGTYTNVVAVEDTGSGSAADCSVSVSGSTVEITNCALDQDIVIHFSDRASTSGGDSIFGGDSVDSYTIHCAQISDSGVDRTVDDSLAATLETSTEAEVTPSFAISTELRGIASLTAAEVTQADVGDSIYWTLDVPSDYTAQPSCTAYSGTDNTGTSKTLFTNGCADDDDLVSDDFTSTSTIVPLINRYYVTLYVFKFYDSDDVYFHCTVKVCPSSGSANCAASCTKKKRSIDNSTLEAGDRFFETNRVLHILPTGSGAPTLLGSIWLVVTTILVSRK